MVATRANSASEVRTTTSFPSLLGMGDSVFNHYYFLVLLGNFYITLGSKPGASYKLVLSLRLYKNRFQS